MFYTASSYNQDICVLGIKVSTEIFVGTIDHGITTGFQPWMLHLLDPFLMNEDGEDQIYQPEHGTQTQRQNLPRRKKGLQ